MVDQLLVETIERIMETRTGRRILLMTGGLLVSGVPIDRREFLASLEEVLESDSGERISDETTIVHLKDVIVTDNGNKRLLAYWRGSLEAVSGWSPVGSQSDVLEAFDASWSRNEAGYRYLAGR